MNQVIQKPFLPAKVFLLLVTNVLHHCCNNKSKSSLYENKIATKDVDVSPHDLPAESVTYENEWVLYCPSLKA